MCELKGFRKGLWAWFLLTLALSPPCLAEHPSTGKIYFNIPSLPLKEALQIFVRQARAGDWHIQGAYLCATFPNPFESCYVPWAPGNPRAWDFDLVVRSNPVVGNFDVHDALEEMTRGSGLMVLLQTHIWSQSGPTHTLSIKPDPRPRLTGVTRNPWRPREGESLDLTQITVTGTLIPGIEAITAPLLVSDRREMRKSGYATVREALQLQPQLSRDGPSEDAPGGGNFGRGSSLNLRGLGTGATLVLVDGHRQPLSGADGDFVDVSSIPWSAVDRVEVLSDGASALYGSDAIAGVVNIIMRHDVDGAETQGRRTAAIRGGDESLFSQAFGTDWEHGYASVIYQYSERTALPSGDRAYSANADKRPFGGTDWRSTLANPGNILDPLTLQPRYALPSGQDGRALRVSDLLPGVVNLENQLAGYDLLPDRGAQSLYLNAAHALSDRVELYTDARVARREVRDRGKAVSQLLMVPASNPFVVNPYGAGVPVFVGYSFYDDLGPVTAHGTTSTYVGTLGARFKSRSGWHVNAWWSQGAESLNWRGDNFVNAAALQEALADPDPARAFNPFGAGSNSSRETLDRIRETVSVRARSSIGDAQVQVDGALIRLPGGESKIALGIAHRRETLDRTEQRRSEYERGVSSAFMELNAPVLPHLDLSLAGRLEQYTDFGKSTNPKVGLTWTPARWWRARTTWGTSFRAPKLIDLDESTLQNASGLLVLPDPKSASGQSVVLARQGNNAHLRQETARTWTAGFDLALPSLDGLSFSVTYFGIDYNDRIVVPAANAPFDILFREDEWAAAVRRSPDPAWVSEICHSSTFLGNAQDCLTSPPAAIVDYRLLNLASTRMRGLDLDVREDALDLPVGNLALRVRGSYVLRFSQAESSHAPQIDAVGTVGNPPVFRLRAMAEWFQHAANSSGWSLSAAVNYTDRYRDVARAEPQSVASSATFDLQASFRTAAGSGPFNDLTFEANAVNVFNRPVPFVDRELGYDTSNYDPFGRLLSVRLQKNW